MAMSGTGQGFFSFVVAGGAVDVDSVGVVVTAVRARRRLQWPSSQAGQWLGARSLRVWSEGDEGVREMEVGSLGEGYGGASQAQSVLGFHQFNFGAVMLVVGLNTLTGRDSETKHRSEGGEGRRGERIGYIETRESGCMRKKGERI
ncbi:hypothetical protein Dimus_029255, partial [Dionaea muscipula]